MTVNYEIGKPRQDKRMRITIILCVGKTKKRIKTNLLATQADLNRKGKIKNDSYIYSILRERMFAIEKEYIALDTFVTGEHITANEAIERIRHSDIPTFRSYTDRWISRATMKGKKNYITAINNFMSFLRADIPFSAFSHTLLNDYLYSLKDKTRAQSLYFNAIKKIYDDAEKEYNLTPFSSFRIEAPRPQRAKNRAIDISTLRKIFLWNGTSKRGIIARDCAILSFCLCGTNSVDLFNAPSIKNNTLLYDRTKTKDRRLDNAHIEIKIPQQLMSLVRKYKGSSKAFLFDTIYSNYQSFNKNLNIGLKVIQKDLCIDRLTFYSFRHSWATIARNELGINKYLVHECLNHIDSDTAIDDIYIKKDFKQINIANQKVVDYVIDETVSLPR